MAVERARRISYPRDAPLRRQSSAIAEPYDQGVKGRAIPFVTEPFSLAVIEDHPLE